MAARAKVEKANHDSESGEGAKVRDGETMKVRVMEGETERMKEGETERMKEGETERVKMKVVVFVRTFPSRTFTWVERDRRIGTNAFLGIMTFVR